MQQSDAIVQELFGRTTQGIKLGLERMLAAAAALGNPQNAYRIIHVAGTNGKGSTCACIASMLSATGYSTGLYTSPHIVHFEERFIINGVPVTTEQWLDAFTVCEPVINQFGLTFFEATTLLAFELFKRAGAEWVVLETGLGGRLDATNIVIPKVACITTIALDHSHYLGSTMQSVANEKLGIVKQGVPLVMAEQESPAVMHQAQRHCAALNTSCTIASVNDATVWGTSENGITFQYNNVDFDVPLRGAYQLQNSITALKVMECAGFFDYTRMAAGMKQVFVPGRFQEFRINNRTVVFDVGHNPNAAEAFVKALMQRYPGKPVIIVTGIMKDKDYTGILVQYGRVASHIVVTQPSVERAATPEVLIAALPESLMKKSTIAVDIPHAMEHALRFDDALVCVTGSFYTVGEAMAYLNIEPYPQR
jgi:dihydrofolate synthase/folylpolyglutamate synthase